MKILLTLFIIILSSSCASNNDRQPYMLRDYTVLTLESALEHKILESLIETRCAAFLPNNDSDILVLLLEIHPEMLNYVQEDDRILDSHKRYLFLDNGFGGKGYQHCSFVFYDTSRNGIILVSVLPSVAFTFSQVGDFLDYAKTILMSDVRNHINVSREFHEDKYVFEPGERDSP